jgi:hypothetical protein
MLEKVVVLIFTHKARPDLFEKIAFQQCVKVLASHPIVMVCPRGMDVSLYRQMARHIEIDEIDAKWFRNLQSYNLLKIHPWLYRRYSNYEFLLTYELDAFVFRDELLEWCEAGWDYIGAPWFEHDGHWNYSTRFRGVGNSGFSLRRINSILRVSYTLRYQKPMREVVLMWRQGILNTKGLLGMLTFQNNFFFLLNRFHGHEDVFWGQLVPARFPWFRVPSCEKASEFAFEAMPEFLYVKNSQILPFGCHKWAETHRNFWFPIVRKEGYIL